MRIRISVTAIVIFSAANCFGQGGFKVVPLGVKGGGDDGNLSAYMVAPIGSTNYICLDAGTLSHGIQKAISRKAFSVSADEVLKKYIKAYFISHPHLDHLSGMIINSTDDTVKNLYGFEHCIETIKNHYFNWQSWPNMGNEGNNPALEKYNYKVLAESQLTVIDQTEMSVQAFRLSHSNPYESAAFLIKNGENYLLYFGDTGTDEVEKSNKMELVWRAVAPLVRNKTLMGILLEVSYPNDQPDRRLYGHLTPNWFMRELSNLEKLAGQESLKNLNVIVTHLKPTGNNEQTIRHQLTVANTWGLNLIFPEQGKSFELK
ncbi:MBL fold metallo-hydrolase [Dyadobacter arcticus]|uniref:3',5'-cyclic-nucleotide phosphodiesterase n=1 Tax=Dyadobacter arcticus TaxID=1078754 RepID=A0ABX0UQK5_9BACT|nr:3',5'-cyclic-nucleotide phosphodiesterase [Dyadobacter arcticus]NIJ55278.1 3',5'-cyclic-nucleotide phosphodiesterase [Dyadobacter arcticus]